MTTQDDGLGENDEFDPPDPPKLHRELLRLLAGVTDVADRAEIISEYWRCVEDAEELDRERGRRP